MEQWHWIYYRCYWSGQNPWITKIYFLCWMFLGNYVLLNLFLAIIFDGFADTRDTNFSLLQEDLEINQLRDKKDKDLKYEKDK